MGQLEVKSVAIPIVFPEAIGAEGAELAESEGVIEPGDPPLSLKKKCTLPAPSARW